MDETARRVLALLGADAPDDAGMIREIRLRAGRPLSITDERGERLLGAPRSLYEIEAAADALTLSRIARKVFLVHRRDTLRATKVYHEPLARAGNVEFRWNSEAAAFLGNDRLTGLLLRDVLTGETRELPCDAVFVSVGRAPETELFREQLALDAAGYIIADESTQTSLPGVFAVGDVRTKALRQIVTAVADGATAVHYAEEYLAKLG